MRKKTLLTALLALALPITCQASATDDVNRFFTTLADALSSHNLEAIGNAWNEQGEAVTLAGGIYKGREEIRALFNEGFSGPYKQAKYEYSVQYVRPDGDTRATVDGVWKISNGGPPNYPSCGVFLATLSKASEVWRLDMSFSSVPRPGHTAEHGRTLSWEKTCGQQPTSSPPAG